MFVMEERQHSTGLILLPSTLPLGNPSTGKHTGTQVCWAHLVSLTSQKQLKGGFMVCCQGQGVVGSEVKHSQGHSIVTSRSVWPAALGRIYRSCKVTVMLWERGQSSGHSMQLKAIPGKLLPMAIDEVRSGHQDATPWHTFLPGVAAIRLTLDRGKSHSMRYFSAMVGRGEDRGRQGQIGRPPAYFAPASLLIP